MGRPVTQWQIVAKDPERAANFYAQLFDWKVDADNALNYRMIDTQSDKGIPGGIWPCPPEGHPLVQLFVEVEDVQAYLDKAQELGGNVVLPPQMLPDGDEMAMIVDPEGMSIGLWKPA